MATSRDIIWSETSYTPGSLLKSYADKLPLIVLVDKGHYGDNDTETVAVDQIARIHSWVNQRRVLARDVRGRMLSIPEDYSIKMEVLGKKGKRKKAKKLKHIVRHYYLPLTVGFDRSARWRFRVGQHIWDTADFGLLQLCRCYTVSYLRGNAIHAGVIQSPVLLLPMYIDINMRVAEGLRNGTPAEWKELQHAYSTAVNKARAVKVTGESGITLVTKGGVDAKNFAGQGVLVTNNNSLTYTSENKQLNMVNGREPAQSQTTSTTASEQRNTHITNTSVENVVVRQNSATSPAANGGVQLVNQNGNVATIHVGHNDDTQRQRYSESSVEETSHYRQQHMSNSHQMVPLSVNVGATQANDTVLSVDERGVSRVEIGGGGGGGGGGGERAAHYNDNGVHRSRSLNGPSYRRMARQDYVVQQPVFDARKDTTISRSTGDIYATYDQPVTYYEVSPEVRGERRWYQSLGGGQYARSPSPSPQYYYTTPGHGHTNVAYYRQGRPRPRSVSGGGGGGGGYVRDTSKRPVVREVYRRDGLQIGLSDEPSRSGELYYTTQPTAFGGSAQNLYHVEPTRRTYVTRQVSMRDMNHYGTMPEYVSRSGELNRVFSTSPRNVHPGRDMQIQHVGSVTVHGPGLVSSLADNRRVSSSVSSSPRWRMSADDQHGVYVQDNTGVHNVRRYHSAKDGRRQWTGETVRVMTNGGVYRDEHVSRDVRRPRDVDQRADYAIVNRTGLTKRTDRRLRAVPITLDTDTDSSNSEGRPKVVSSEKRTAKQQSRSPALQSKSGDVHYEQKSPPPPPPAPPLPEAASPMTSAHPDLPPASTTSATKQASTVDVNQNVISTTNATKTVATKKNAPLVPRAEQQATPETSVMTSSDFYSDRDGNTTARQTASSYAYQQSASRNASGALITQQMQQQQTTTRTTTTTKAKELSEAAAAVVMRRDATTAAAATSTTDGRMEKDVRESIRDLDNFLQSQSESDNSQHQEEHHKDLSLQAEVETSWL